MFLKIILISITSCLNRFIHFEYYKIMLDKRVLEFLEDYTLEELPLDYIGTTFFGDIYKYHGVLGFGSFGIVLKVREISSNLDFALKVTLHTN